MRVNKDLLRVSCARYLANAENAYVSKDCNVVI